MSELDELLGGALKRAAQPGDPTGVADAIRSRVDAGDTGTPAANPGFGTAGGLLGVLPWIGLVLVTGVLGAIVGVTGVFGLAAPAAASGLSVSVTNTVAGLACPAGGPLVQLQPGERVLAVQRSQDTKYLAVRDPYQLDRTVWVATGAVVIDKGEKDAASLPVGGCPTPTTSVTPEPTIEVAPEPEPSASKKPSTPTQPGQPAGDTSGPAMGSPTASNTKICYTGSGFTPTTSVITVSADDPSGVASVVATWSTVGGSPKNLAHGSGTNWSFTFSSPPVGSQTDVTITLTAKDALGNASTRTIVVTVLYQTTPCTLI